MLRFQETLDALHVDRKFFGRQLNPTIEQVKPKLVLCMISNETADWVATRFDERSC